MNLSPSTNRPVRCTRASIMRGAVTSYTPRKRARQSNNAPRPKRHQTTRSAPESNAVVEDSQQPSILNTLTNTEKNLEGHMALRHVFPFMRLPAELRVHIYRMALQRDTPLLLHLPRPTAGETENEGKMLESHITDKFPSGRHFMIGAESINTNLMSVCHTVHREARPILYGDNTFILSLTSGIHTLSALHQRSRSLIKSVSLTIPNHHDILDNFADVVRLGLRYCWGLKSLTIVLPMHIPDGGYLHATTSIYSNAFHILRWLPKGGKVVLDGSGVSDSIKKVVEEEGRLMVTLDEVCRGMHKYCRMDANTKQRSYLKRQHQMPERH